MRYNPENIQRVVARKVLRTFVRNRDGNSNAPYLVENDGEVVLNWNWLDNDWNANEPALRFRNSLHFPAPS
jgi:hypothetical protein